MKQVSKILTASTVIAVTMAALALQPVAAQGATDVYVVAAGDIACDPSPAGTPNFYAAYNNGLGTKDGCRQKAVGDAVIAAKPDQFWALGDNQYFDGTYAKYMEVYDKAFGAVKAITHPVPGNHEWKDLTIPTKPGAGYYTYFGAAAHPETDSNYSFDAGDWHVVAINDNLCDMTHPCGEGSAMATWLANDLAANQKPCTVAMWHHPLWSLGEAHKGGYGPLVPLWNQLYDAGVDMVVTGHDHNYVRTVALGKTTVNAADPSKVALPTPDPKGMVEFVIGTGGVDNYAASAATATQFGPALAAYQVGKPSPGLFGAGGFHLKSDRYTFAYLPAANSAPFTDNGGRTCRRATNGNPQDVPGEASSTTLPAQKVTWAPTNTSIKLTSNSAATFTPSDKPVTTGDGAITYSVTAAGTTGCTVDPTKGVVTYTDAGECEVTATATATAKYAMGYRSVVFTITSTVVHQKADMTAVQPAAGPMPGGNTITLVGHGFTGATKVTIGGKSAKFEALDDTHISTIVPAGKQAGAVTIVVTIGPPQGAIVAPTAYTYETATTPTTAPVAVTAAPATAAVVDTLLGNPAVGKTIAAGVRLLSRTEALHIKSTVLHSALGTSPATAPTVRIKAGTPLSLVVRGHVPDQVVNVRGSVHGTPMALGAARATSTGWLRVPAFSSTRLGPITIALESPSSGKRSYLKVLVVK